MRIGTRDFNLNRKCYVMGILNVTPDSFSDGGKFSTLDRALFQARKMIEEGADILDIGGESTRPGYTQISPEEEIQRVVPVLEGIRREFDIPLSIDTYKSQVAEEALNAGADMVNDIWGLVYDDRLGGIIAKAKAAYCLMHNRMGPAGRRCDFIEVLKRDLKNRLSLAKQAGIPDERIILDPGIGFGKAYMQNLEIMCRLQELLELGYPLLLGASRKSFIGLTLGLPVTERLEGTLATTVFAVGKGCSFVRVHDVQENVRVIQMAEAMMYGWRDQQWR